MKNSFNKILYILFILLVGLFSSEEILITLKKNKSENINTTLEEEEKTEKEKEGESTLTQKFQKKRKIGGGNDFFSKTLPQVIIPSQIYYTQKTIFPKDKLHTQNTQALYILYHNLKIACSAV